MELGGQRGARGAGLRAVHQAGLALGEVLHGALQLTAGFCVLLGLFCFLWRQDAGVVEFFEHFLQLGEAVLGVLWAAFARGLLHLLHHAVQHGGGEALRLGIERRQFALFHGLTGEIVQAVGEGLAQFFDFAREVGA